ncbi:MAG: type II toxin-antitoxin system HipA family toxin [Steroidobacteraceae bacterium]
MARPATSHTLSIWMNGLLVGHWTAAPRQSQQFSYADEWLRSRAARPISLSMPLGPSATIYRGATVENYFDNLLPDNRAIRERLRQRFDARSGRSFDLLAEIGRDCIGAIQVLPEGAARPDVRRIDGDRLDEAGIEQELVNALAGNAPGRTDRDEFRISLAGAQEKTALLRIGSRWLRPAGATPTTHILKLPLGVFPQGIDMSLSLENEWLCAQVLRAYAVPVANCSIERFGRHKVLVVERFDRQFAADRGWIMRIPQEDFCQVTATAREDKYEADSGPGIEQIMELLLGSADAEADRMDFFRTQTLFWMLCAIDGHAKNFSIFLESEGRFRLTPRYDVLSAFPVVGTKAGQLSPRKVKMAMAVNGTKSRHYHWSRILRRHWLQTARRCGVAARAEAEIEALIVRTPKAVDEVAGALPAGFPEAISRPVLQGLVESARKLAVH